MRFPLAAISSVPSLSAAPIPSTPVIEVSLDEYRIFFPTPGEECDLLTEGVCTNFGIMVCGTDRKGALVLGLHNFLSGHGIISFLDRLLTLEVCLIKATVVGGYARVEGDTDEDGSEEVLERI